MWLIISIIYIILVKFDKVVKYGFCYLNATEIDKNFNRYLKFNKYDVVVKEEKSN